MENTRPQVTAQVFNTTDYDLFKTLKGNRKTNRQHIKRLTASMRDRYLMSPIIVNEEFYIIDGQHRYESAKAEGLPINYIICNNYGLKEVQLLNTNTQNWKQSDYLNAYCDMGYPEYLKAREFRNTYPELTFRCTLRLLTDIPSLGTSSALFNGQGCINPPAARFIDGEMIIPDLEKSYMYADRIMSIKPYFSRYNNSNFVLAMCKCFDNPEYNHEHFMKKIRQFSRMINNRSTIDGYLEDIEALYNYKSRDAKVYFTR